MPDGKRAFVALGSNLGDRVGNCRTAIKRLCSHEKVKFSALSSFYENRPVGIESENWFVNAVLEIRTCLSPLELLELLLEVEKSLGRDRDAGPDRTIDLDLLYFEGEKINTKELVLPHPRFVKRDFVLIPWAEIAPDFFVTEFGNTVSGLLKLLSIDNASIYKLEE